MLPPDDHVEIFDHRAVHAPHDQAINAGNHHGGNKDHDPANERRVATIGHVGATSKIRRGKVRGIDEHADGTVGREEGRDGC